MWSQCQKRCYFYCKWVVTQYYQWCSMVPYYYILLYLFPISKQSLNLSMPMYRLSVNKFRYKLSCYYLPSDYLLLNRYKIVLDTDAPQYGGHSRLDHSTEFFTDSEAWDNRYNHLLVSNSVHYATVTENCFRLLVHEDSFKYIIIVNSLCWKCSWCSYSCADSSVDDFPRWVQL